MNRLVLTIAVAAFFAAVTSSASAQCSATDGIITVTLDQVNQSQFQYQWTVTNSDNGNGNRLTDVWFEIGSADTVSTSTVVAGWTNTIELVDATWTGLHFLHASGPSICAGGGSCGSTSETFNYALNQLVSSVRVRTIQANGHQADFTNFNSSTPGCEFLPVELASFDAQADARSILLSWTTASEDNSAGFEVQHRRADRFEAIGFVAAAGNSDRLRDYSFVHHIDGPAFGAYRLKMIDLDGTFEYSPIVEIAGSLPDGHYLSPGYPNPFNPEMSIELLVERDQHVRVEVYDVLGGLVATLADRVLSAGQNTVLTFRADGLPSGLYIVRAAGATFGSYRTVTLLK